MRKEPVSDRAADVNIDLKKQKEYTEMVKTVLSARYSPGAPLAFVHTYGCQGNVADSESIKGMLNDMGYGFTENIEEAQLILYNTCAIREHAEDRVFGNIGAVKRLKTANRELIIALCGCMVQQTHIADRIYKSFPFVDLVFGTHATAMFPELMYKTLCTGKRVFELPDGNGRILEGVPIYRDSTVKAWLPVMYGCNNFCSYCIVPYVRGRERSRDAQAVLAEAKLLADSGYKEITLLGQNVNSYNGGMSFAQLIREINKFDGEFLIRFMTSHPKDCTHELLEAMAECDKCAKHLHLPVQSGNNRILSEMNRKYTRESYLDLIKYARRVMPELSITSDIIVGFPGETYEEFRDTLSLLDEVKYTSLFTFIFSAREGTKAASMPDPVPTSEKSKWFQEMLDRQESIASERTAAMKGKTYRVLCEEWDNGIIRSRTQGNIIIEFESSDALVGKYADVLVTEPRTWIVKGKIAENN